MNDGWRCPGCGRCYAPFVSVCSYCKPFTFDSTDTGPVQTYNIWQCQFCGGQVNLDGSHICNAPPITVTISKGDA